MALISPGVEVTVFDESQYAPNANGTIPYILVATAQDKAAGTGSGIAEATVASEAGKVRIVSSQRELVSLYGKPVFKRAASGTPIHGSELNEYGLMTAYSLLGVTNRVYVQRANIDLSELEATSVRPTNDAADGTYWLNTDTSDWGIFQWNRSLQDFEAIDPIVITNVDDLDVGTVPKESVGNIGQYAVVATDSKNPVYYKNYENAWVQVGSAEWQNSNFAVQGTIANPIMVPGDSIIINDVTVQVTTTTIAALANAINSAGIVGVSARNNAGKLEIFADATATTDGSTADGSLELNNGSGTPLADLGITPGKYYGPTITLSPHTQVPRYKSNDPMPRPTGSVWVKTTSANGGAKLALSRYSIVTDSFENIAAPLYENDQTALKNLDAIGGGLNVAQNSVYAQYDVLENDTASYKLYIRAKQGITTVIGSVNNPIFTAGSAFTIQSSQTGVAILTEPVTINVTGTTAANVVAAILAKTSELPNVTAQVTSTGALSISHTKGGVLVLKNTVGTPLSAAGITNTTTYARAGNNNDIIVSNFVPLRYVASGDAPNSDPSDGRLWFYGDTNDIDIMIHDGSNWVGYLNESVDARGYALGATNPAGPFVSASQPTEQSDGTPIEYGDLWIDTGDMDNFPVIYRYSNVGGSSKWVLVDNTDQTSENGILFADARWGTSGNINPVVDEFPSIVDLLTSDYLDLDAPDPSLYPRGTLLFNTRRSGNNVKRFVKNYFNEDRFADTLPVERDAWVSAAGLQDDGSPYMGRKAVRQMVVTAMRAAITSSTELREEQRAFTLMATPGYPELIPNMVALNNDRKNTAFIVGDTPMRLRASSTDIQNWANDVDKKGTGEFGLTISDPYVGVFYPCGQTNDLDGNTIVVPSSYIAMYTMLRSDANGYPWFAAAGVRRGLVGNVSNLGYINGSTGEFTAASITSGLRDTMYESKINPITTLTGVGQVVYGNKSLGVDGSALDRINVARLVVYLRRVLDLASRNFVFEPNDKQTRDEIKQVIERALNDLIAKRAITDYVVVCDESNNTPIRRDRNELYVDVAIEPVKAVEFIYVPLRIKAQGALSGS